MSSVPARPVALRLAAAAMATRFELVLVDADGSDLAQARLRAAGEQALQEIRECEARLSAFSPGSAIGRLNAAAAGQWLALDGDTFDLLAECARLTADSGGAFDVTVGALMAALGFRGTPAAATAGAADVGMAGLELDADRCAARRLRPGLAVDLGAIGKGHALDAAAAVLRECGVTDALLHGGTSTVLGLGHPPDRPGWRIAVAGEGAPQVVLRDRALAVSAQHGRTEQNRGHVLDPAAGAPAGGAESAAVLAPDARTADAWSTAVLVAGDDTRLPARCSASVCRGGRWTAATDFEPP